MKKIKIDKKKLYEFSNKHINSENVKLLILFIPLVYLLAKQISQGEFILEDFYDTSILVSFLIVFVCEAIASIVMTVISKYTEDSVKLTEDYNSLVNKYVVNKKDMVFVEQDGKKIYVPEIVLLQRKINGAPFQISVEANLKDNRQIRKYTLPKQVSDNSSVLFEAHKSSTVYNNINIRLDDLRYQEDGHEVILKYSFTTYYDSLITNRAMDYKFKNTRTIREVYEPGPMLSALCESKLSNHLGFNGFVELNDGSIIFVLRGRNVSIAKGMWSQSVGASLKTKYCLEESGRFTREGLSKAIRNEITDELKIEIDTQEDLCNSVFAFYRDLVEGGKPQFLFYYKTNRYNKEQFESHFKAVMSKKANRKENKKKQIVDGEIFEYFTIDELKRCRFGIDKMIAEKDGETKEYHMMPSSVGSVILLLQNL